MPKDNYPTEQDFNNLSNQVSGFVETCELLGSGMAVETGRVSEMDAQSNGTTKLAAAQIATACKKLAAAADALVAAIPE